MSKGAMQLLLQIGTMLYKAKVLAKTQEINNVFVINIKKTDQVNGTKLLELTISSDWT